MIKVVALIKAKPELTREVILDGWYVTGDMGRLDSDGHVTLTGRVAWMFQKRDAEKVVRHVRGVRGVMNYIAVTPSGIARDVHETIVDVLARNDSINPQGITVTVSEDMATLSGTVRTWLQRESAERVAADAPGISRVDNQIVVERADLSIRDSLDAI